MLEVLLDPASVRPAEEEAVAVAGTDAVDLLVVWLHEILLRADARKRAFAQVRVSEVAEGRLAATLRGEPLRKLLAAGRERLGEFIERGLPKANRRSRLEINFTKPRFFAIFLA